MVFSSDQPPMSSAPPACSFDDEVDAGEPIMEGNLPELLAQDLEASGAIFTSRDMTAGCPGTGLAAPGLDASPSFEKLRLSYSTSYRHCPQQEVSMNLLHLESHVMDEAASCFEHHDNGQQRGVKERSPDSSSVTSIAMDPLFIRTRQPSVTTAATSLSGRCSLFSSHNPLSPNCSQRSARSSSRRRSSPGTWYEADPESPRGGLSSVSTARTSISDSYALASHLGDNPIMSTSPKSTADWVEMPTMTALNSPGSRSGHTSQSRTPASQLHLEKPRIVTIPPASMSRKNAVSAKESHYGAEPNPMTSETQGTAAVPPVIERQRHGNRFLDLQSELSMPLIAMANGRTIIDASGPPSTGLARPPVEPDRSVIFDDSETGAETHGEVLTEARKLTFASFRRWVNSGAEAPTSPQNLKPQPPNAPSPGIPLPPEVIESLRVSIACFPETMLLTSSLSIETIRAYSKRLKHRTTDLERHSGSTHKGSIYPSSSRSDGPNKRWNVTWLGTGRSSNSSQYHQPPPPGSWSQQQHAYPLSQSHQPPTAGGDSTLSLGPIWAPIRNVFTSASDYMCDALYAHLLAHNYITSLLPPARPVSPPPTPPRRPSTGTGMGHPQRRHGSADANESRNLKIPQKAASLLGMDDPVSTRAAYHHQQQQQHQQNQRSKGGRGLLSRRFGSNRAAQDIFSLSSRPGTRSGVGGCMKGQEGTASVAVMREIQAGLGRCIALLVATMNKETTGGGLRGAFDEDENEDEDHNGLVLVARDGDAEKWDGGEVDERVQPVLMRALYEVVRCAEAVSF